MYYKSSLYLFLLSMYIDINREINKKNLYLRSIYTGIFIGLYCNPFVNIPSNDINYLDKDYIYNYHDMIQK